MSKTYIIAEIGINHNGDINLAKELIVGAYKSGCDAVKFQKRTIDEVYSKEDLDKPRESPWGSTNREQKEGLEFSVEQYKELHRFTKKMQLDFIVSCWDLKSVDTIEKHIDVDYLFKPPQRDKQACDPVNRDVFHRTNRSSCSSAYQC